MNFRETMRVSRSKAEDDIETELQRRGLNKGLETNYYVEFDFEEDLVHFTMIDDAWPHLMYAAFIDGIKVEKGFAKLHLTLHQSRRDERVTKALEKRHWTVDRFQYKPPLSKRRKLEICDKIQARITEKQSVEYYNW